MRASLVAVVGLLSLGASSLARSEDIFVGHWCCTAGGGGVLKVDPVTGAVTPFSVGGFLGATQGIDFEADGDIVVSDWVLHVGQEPIWEGVVRIDPNTGNQTLLSQGGLLAGAGANLGHLAVGPNGSIYVSAPNALTGEPRVVRVDPATGAQSIVSSGGLLYQGGSSGIAVEANGSILAAGDSLPLVRIHPTTGAQTGLGSPSSALVANLGGIEVDAAGDIFVTTWSNEGVGQIVRVDPATGAESLVASGGNLVGPIDLAIDENGDLVVLDYDADARIIRVDPATGAQTVVSTDELLYSSFAIATGVAGAVIADCADGVDNDGDTKIDFPADAGCRTAGDISEASDCGDGLDNDLDGAFDYPADPGCASASSAIENAQCDDDVDNDGDGLIDFGSDPHCSAGWDNREAARRRGCGLGVELVLLAVPLVRWSARRERRSRS